MDIGPLDVVVIILVIELAILFFGYLTLKELTKKHNEILEILQEIRDTKPPTSHRRKGQFALERPKKREEKPQ